MYSLLRATKTYSTFPLKQYTPPAQIKHTLHTQPEVTYAQITKEHPYTPTNIKRSLSANKRYTKYKNINKYVEKPV
jgi:hypothetical protein